jgi:hypothetical protein
MAVFLELSLAENAQARTRRLTIKGMADRKVSLELERDEVGGRIGGAEPRPAPPPVQHCSRTEE